LATADASESEPFDAEEPLHQYGIWAGAASLSNLGGLEDRETDGRRVFILGLRYGRVLLRRNAFTLHYAADLIPFALETDAIVDRGTAGGGLDRATVYGFGVSPLGARLMFRPLERLRPFVGLRGGFLLFSEEIPIPGARRFTYTGDAEVGVEVRLDGHKAIQAGLRFHHVSNANTGAVNPGLNAFAFYTGLTFFRP
jgi:hypothetical protein